MGALRQAVYYAIGIVMMKGVSLMMLPYITSRLSVHEYGALEALVLIADIGTIIIGFGLIDALYRFAGSSEGKEKKRLISNCFTLSIIITIVGLLLVWLSLPWLVLYFPADIEGYQVLLIAIPTSLEGLIAIPLTLMRMNALAKRFCLFNVLKAVVQAVLVIVLLEANMGVDGVLIASMISSILLLLCLLHFQWQQMAEFGCLKYSMKLFKFGGPVVISGIGLFAITGLDRWLLADQVGVEMLAVYAIATKFALILALVLQPFAMWWFPNRIQILQQCNGLKICADYAMLGTNIGLYVAFTMMLTVPGFISLLLPAEYHLAAQLVVGLLFVNAIKNASDYLNLGCFSGDSTQGQMWVQWLCSIIAIAGYWWLIPLWGVWASIGVLAVVYCLRLILLYWLSQSLLPLPYDHTKWIKTLLLCVVFFTLSSLSSLVSAPLQQIFISVVYSLLFLVSLIFWQVFPNVFVTLWGKCVELFGNRVLNKFT